MASETAELPERLAIGIQFGNSYSSIAYTSPEGKAEVIANEDGDRQIPSILSYIDGEEFQGTQAKTQLVRNSKNTVAYFRDFIGKSFSAIDPTPCHGSAHPQEHDSTIAFTIRDTTDEKPSTVTISEITTRHIKKLASSASDFIGKPVTAAVFTVPSNFSDEQKEALTAAAKKADIEVLQYISEPVAAVLAYDARNHTEVADKVVVVADLGGTRSDVAVVACRGGIYTVLATAHDFEFAGRNLDQVLIDYFSKEFIKKHKTDPRENERSLAKLKLEAEATKKALSIGQNASFSVESLADGIDFTSTVNRTRYELLSNKVFGGFTRLIESVISKAGLHNLDVDEIILAGGTSHTPKIAENIKSIFSIAKIFSPSTTAVAINPSDLAARGAAIQASLISHFDAEDISQSTHPAVTAAPHLSKAIGVLLLSSSDKEGVFRPILDSATALPARRALTLTVPKDGGDVLIKLVEASRGIKTTTKAPEPKQTNGTKNEDDDSEDDEDDEDDEPEEIHEKIWTVEGTLAEGALKETKKGGKVEVVVNVNVDLSVAVQIREVGGKGGVRGVIEA